MDEAGHIGCNGEPFWYCGVLHVNRMEGSVTRAAFDRGEEGLNEGTARFDEIYERRMADGGGLISIYYHPCEWATTAFWDGVNFGDGAMPPRHDWRPAPLRPSGGLGHSGAVPSPSRLTCSATTTARPCAIPSS